MNVTLVGCPCLSGKILQLRALLVAEGVTVTIQKIRRPGHLQVIVGGRVVWAWRLFRKMPTQQELAALVRGAVI